MLETIHIQDFFLQNRRSFDHVQNVFAQTQNLIQDQTDEALVAKIQKGDTQHFETIVNRYSQKLHRYLYYYFNFNPILSDEVTQEAFIKLREKIHKIDTSRKFESRLYRFMHNYTIDWLRKNSKHEQVLSFTQMNKHNEDWWQKFEENFVVSDEDVKTNAEHAVQSDIIKNLLNKLDNKYKDVVLLFYFEQKSYEEISYILKIKLAHVGVLLSRAKQKLKIHIEANPKLKETLSFDL